VEEVKMRAIALRTQYSKLLKAKPSGSGEKPLTSKQKWLLFLKNMSPHTPLRAVLVLLLCCCFLQYL